MTDQEAYVTLNLLPQVGPVTVRRLLEAFGTPQRVLQARSSELAKVSGIRRNAANTIANWRQHASATDELALAARAGVQVITMADEAYPAMLRELYDPPLCLYVRGRLEAFDACASCSIALVGSRRITHYGHTVTEQLAAAATRGGWCVVSGLALGVDTVAHRTTLTGQGTTVAVIGSGLGRIYPSDNVTLAREIAESGAVVSELPFNTPPDKRWFPMRNRIIAALSQGTIVVEAAHKSGALITAQQALDLGRNVFAVPGPVTAPQSRGCHRLLREGATLVESFGDVLDAFGLLLKTTPAPEQQPRLFPDLGAEEQVLVDLLSAGEQSADELVHASGLAAHQTLATLLMLEVKKVIIQLPGRRYQLRHG